MTTTYPALDSIEDLSSIQTSTWAASPGRRQRLQIRRVFDPQSDGLESEASDQIFGSSERGAMAGRADVMSGIVDRWIADAEKRNGIESLTPIAKRRRRPWTRKPLVPTIKFAPRTADERPNVVRSSRQPGAARVMRKS